MQFVHLSDTHLGYRQYGLVARENDFLEVFNQAMDEIVEERPDFAIHSGDLFESSRPPTRALMAAQSGFSKLNEAEIPVYGVAGNHDVIMRKNALPPHILFKRFGLKLLSPKNPSFIHGDVFIGGAPYATKYQSKFFVEHLNRIEESAMDYKKRILVLHQGLDQYIPVDYELKIGDLPRGFNYYALGHIHDRLVDDYADGKLAYAGSTELWRFNEVEAYLKNGKGFYLVDLGGDIPEIEKIDLKLPRNFIKKSIKFNKLQEDLENLVKRIEAMQNQPLAMITVKGGNLNRADIYETINTALSDLCLALRSKYKPTPSENGESRPNSTEGLTIDTLIEKNLEEFMSDKVTKFGVELQHELSEGDVQVAYNMANEFYGAVE